MALVSRKVHMRLVSSLKAFVWLIPLVFTSMLSKKYACSEDVKTKSQTSEKSISFMPIERDYLNQLACNIPSA